ncbi:hypothetical protein [Gallalistipes aquisgranensis]|uniref:hypothetical protein n=1 Tax=Gallalistipes aquisgranensis TaxID=2779358 RepID=UPI001CF8E075|nr:hypothetical protein [Gallalistipes aquisgranensis]MBE5033340.1 hypothetical protein [Gallalistipes aquisgranensis]
MLGKGRTPSSTLSATIPNGIGKLKFTYMQAFSTKVNFTISVDGAVVGTYNDTSAANDSKTVTIDVNKVGNVKIEFAQVGNSSGQVCIADVQWTNYSK